MSQVFAATCLALLFFALAGCEPIGTPVMPVTTAVVTPSDYTAASVDKVKPQELTFNTLERSVIGDYIVAEIFQEPELRVFSSLEDLESEKELKKVKEIEDQLLAFDYENSFAILVLDGPPASLRSDRVAVKQILRQGDQVMVQAEFPGPPSENEELLPSASLPYHLVSVRKDGEWGTEMTFVLEGVTDGVETTLLETKHFIP